MTVEPTPATPVPATPVDEVEPIATSVVRVIGGGLLMIVTGALAIVSFAYYVAGAFLPGGENVSDLGDFLLYVAIFAFVGAVTGFEIMRRSRKRRKAEAAEAAGIVQRVQAAQANGTLSAATIDSIVDGPTGEDGQQGLQWDGPAKKV